MIGYYVHHQGSGHLNRARTIARHCPLPVTGLSTLPRPGDWPGPWVRLPADDDGDPTAFGDVTAGGRFHWAPILHAGLRGRMALIAQWIADTSPRLLVCDVSVEVAALARLLGTPTAVVAMRGERTDAPHRLAYDLADLLLAPWPATLPEPGWPRNWRDKTVHTGAFSRFDGRPPLPHEEETADATGGERPPKVLLMLGTGGTDISPGDVKAAREATPGWQWTRLGGPDAGWSADPWPALCAADVVITHAGQNAVAECAAARRPAVVVPQERPFGEQTATGRALTRGRLAVVTPGWPEAEAWPGLLEQARALGGDGWPRWAPGDGAARAARALADAVSGAGAGAVKGSADAATRAGAGAANGSADSATRAGAGAKAPSGAGPGDAQAPSGAKSRADAGVAKASAGAASQLSARPAKGLADATTQAGAGAAKGSAGAGAANGSADAASRAGAGAAKASADSATRAGAGAANGSADSASRAGAR
ncbi:glycosyltransferase [Streptomyces sp. NPDC007084]|uniref:glycosyltransferase n=1 Tax=Streptomyces sp. NPDC007084 TaxID=3154313 RepID=UPI0034541389